MSDEQLTEAAEISQRFHEAVNMTSRELRDWLASPARPQVPPPQSAQDSPLGPEVLEVLSKRHTDLTGHDLEVMRRVIEVVEEETSDVSVAELLEDERRRFRLLNVGHDPLR